MIRIKDILFFFIIIITFVICIYSTGNLFESYESSIDNNLKFVFNYIDKNDSIFSGLNTISYIIQFSILLFYYIYITISNFGVTRPYRSMILLRFGARTKYISAMIKGGFISCIKGLVFIIASFSGSYLIINQSFNINSDQVVLILLLLLNMFIFMFELSLLSIFLTIRYNDFITIISGILIINCFLSADVVLEHVNIITYGSLQNLLASSFILLLICLSLRIFISSIVKKTEII